MYQVDRADMQLKIVKRKPENMLPLYPYGADYQGVEQEPLYIPAI